MLTVAAMAIHLAEMASPQTIPVRMSVTSASRSLRLSRWIRNMV